MGGVERLDSAEQAIVRRIIRLVVRRDNDRQRRGVVDESLAAAVRALDGVDEIVDAIEVGVRVAVVPNAQREQAGDVGEVVVEQNCERCRIALLVAALLDDVMKDVDDDHVVVDAPGRAVPVVQDVEAIGARLLIERAEYRADIVGLLAEFERVPAHGVAQAGQRCAKFGDGGDLLDDLAAEIATECV